MTKIVAVSGGVDSVALLHMLAKDKTDELIVAHFDHGIRTDSMHDRAFVQGLAERYGLRFESERAKLGPHASEETARTHRYTFLRKLANEFGATIVTAHHMDDVVETIAINLTRGTGWRGLAVLNDPTIERPLLTTSKSELRQYVLEHGLEWVEDETNVSSSYLRNRIRKKLARFDAETLERLHELWAAQTHLTSAIDKELEQYQTSSRHFMTMIDDGSASELLRHHLAKKSISLTRPQRARVIHAIKTAKPGSVMKPGAQLAIEFDHRNFVVKYP